MMGGLMRRYVVNRDDLAAAAKIREKFYDAPASRAETMDWNWPTSMREVGTCLSVMYASDKWASPGDFTDYKHKAEGPQKLLVTDGFIRDHANTDHEIEVVGPDVKLNRPMPTACAVLAPVLGIQCQLYEGDSREWYLPNGEDGLYQVNIGRAWLGAAKHPATGETFLVVYTKAGGPCCIVVGDILDVEKDGIVG